MPDPKEIRCDSRIIAILTEDGLLEMKCSAKACGAGNGVVVFHYIDIGTMTVVNTKKYKDPNRAFQQIGKKR